MGTTLTAMQAGNVSLDFVIAVEGLEYLVCTGSTSAALTAWAATEWTQAVGNAMIVGDIEQKIEPWDDALDVSNLTFAVLPSANTAAGDAFGRLVFGMGNAAETFLNGEIDCDATTITVLSTAQFPSSGSIHIGTEHIAYTGTTATTFTGCVRGKYAPFKAQSETQLRFGHPHRMPRIGDGISIAPRVTKLQRAWIGRWVGVWAHRVVGGALDTKAEAQCIWAGRISNIRDEANGLAYFDCEDLRSALRDCVLMRDQFTARVAEGLYLRAGHDWRIMARDTKAGTSLTANNLTVVASGASGTNEIDAGLYTLPELLSALNEWLAAETLAGRLNYAWVFTLTGGGEETRTKIRLSDGAATGLNTGIIDAPAAIRDFLGWGPVGGAIDVVEYMSSVSWTGTGAGTMTGPEEPYRTLMYTGANTITLENARGTWFNNRVSTLLPPGLGIVDTEVNVGVLQVNEGPMIAVRYVSDAQVVGVAHERSFLTEISGAQWDDSSGYGSLRRMRWSQAGDMTVRQVAVFEGRPKWLLTMTVASTGTTDYNYANAQDHGDDLPSQFGAAIPWDLLGTNWLADLSGLDDNMSTLPLVIDKPTKWTEVFGAEMIARLMSIVWRGGGLRVVTWGTPTSAHAIHTFTEANKGLPTGDVDANAHRTVANVTREFVVNSIKIEYNRVLSGGYRSSIHLIDAGSQDSYGGKPITLSMRNMFGGFWQTNAVVEELADNLGVAMGTFNQPLHILRRSIAPIHYENVSPGQYCLITDEFARDPATGARGITAKPGLIVRHRVDWGGYEVDTGKKRDPSGSVDILILPLSNVSTYSPAATVSSYVAGTKVLTCVAHDFSESSEAVDASHFAAGDNVYVVETDPDDPTSFLSWSDTIVSISTNDVTLTTGLAAFDAAKTYRMVSDVYTTAVATQKTDAYLADDADGMIQDTVAPYVYGIDPAQATTWTNDDSERPNLYANSTYTEGRPLNPGDEMDRARLCNALVRHRCSSLMSTLQRGTPKTYTGAGRKILEIQPVHVGPGDLILGNRYLRVRVWGRSSDGTSTTVTVSLCRHQPIGSSMTSTDLDAMSYAMVGPYETLTSSAITSTTYADHQFDFSFESVDPSTGRAFIVVEGAAKFQQYGIAQCHPLPYEQAA